VFKRSLTPYTEPGRVGPAAGLNVDHPACAAPPPDTSAQIAHYTSFAPVFTGGVVLQLRGRGPALSAAIAGLGLTDVRTVHCSEDRLLAWLPGVGGDSVSGLTALFSSRGLTVSEHVEISPAVGRSWLRAACTDANRCEQILSTAHPEGLCGLSLSVLQISPIAEALAACRALPASVVMCAVGARDGADHCEQALREAARPSASEPP
jgi:hypothetical protein